MAGTRAVAFPDRRIGIGANGQGGRPPGDAIHPLDGVPLAWFAYLAAAVGSRCDVRWRSWRAAILDLGLIEAPRSCSFRVRRRF
jgi:hypothetical protein